MIGNFRPQLLSLVLLIGVAAPWVANAQASISSSGSVEDRITTLERISNAQGQLLQQLQQQLSDNQREIDSLRGQAQESSYQLQQITERQKHLYQQIDAVSSAGKQETASKGTQQQSAQGEATGQPDSGATTATQGSDANKAYNDAVALVMEKKQYDQAIDAFRNFVSQYPDSTYQPNAHYWLGQLNYNKKKYDDAAYYFATVVKKYPQSPKSSESLYKVGAIMQDKGDTAKAKAVWQQVIKQFPGTSAAKQAQKKIESSKP